MMAHTPLSTVPEGYADEKLHTTVLATTMGMKGPLRSRYPHARYVDTTSIAITAYYVVPRIFVSFGDIAYAWNRWTQKISTQLVMLFALVCFIQGRAIVVYSGEALVGMWDAWKKHSTGDKINWATFGYDRKNIMWPISKGYMVTDWSYGHGWVMRPIGHDIYTSPNRVAIRGQVTPGAPVGPTRTGRCRSV